MMTVRDELVKIHEDTDALVSLVGSDTDISRDLSDDLSRLSSEVQYAQQDQSRATTEYVGALDDRLRNLRDRVASAIEDAGNKISILLLLATDGALESRSDEAGAPLRVISGHPKSQEVLGIQASAKAPKLQQAAFVDLGPEFGVSMSRSEVDKVNNITIIKRKNEYIVRIDYSESGYSPKHYDSRP